MPRALPVFERAATSDQARDLRTWGRHETPDGWRHRKLRYPWPHRDARRVTNEALDGGQDLVHRLLREEE